MTLSPAGARTQNTDPQIVQTSQPKLCVHTRLTDEVEAWKIQKTLQMVRLMGASTIVEFFPWAYAEPDEGRFDWSHADRIINYARQQGLQVIARLGIVPAWARDRSLGARTSLNSLSPDRYDEFARFAGEFVARYAADVRYVLPWNEPNLSFEWGYRSVSPEEYAGFARMVYTAIKARAPGVIVLGGALAPTLEAAGSTNAINDLEFLRRVMATGLGGMFDALSIHNYDLTRSSPDSAPDPLKINFRRAELLVQILRDAGSPMPVFITESGWNDSPRWIYAVPAGLRVAYTREALRIVEEDWSWAQTLCIWNFRLPAETGSYPDYWSLVTPGFQPRAIYEALAADSRAE